ncbi:DoxX family protein [Mangrovibacterium diazotrophicum]|uniref:Putative oxidoreductase n=1 Tax=Mangrovibacterium diazotrophicum TaxID=1261403 RepID=A0A419VYY0_9BACT|nr:DoxX family protein [Mangrovibacterium diazotrophicum]RKD88445.1 putative oxidoreductase [Mangrovibacterium diazotrophicum]
MKTKNVDLGLLIVRIGVGLLMLFHGISKLSGGLGFIQGMLEAKGLPGFIAYGVIVGEVLAPLAILVGFRTRIAALIYAFNMVVAVLMVHAAQFFTMSEQGGWALELIGLYFLGAIALFFTGAGKYAASSTNTWD